IFNLCRRLLNSREDAADAMHEVFLRAAASLFEPPRSPQARGWLTRVARNYCIDLLRRRERFGSALITLAATADPGGDSVQSVEDRELLTTVLRQLGVRDREALWQSAVELRSLPEIARSFNLSYTAAAQLLSRARRRAVLVAARLAVILGLAQLGQVFRRSNAAHRGQQLAAVVVVPIMVAAVVISSSPHAEIGAAATSHAAGAQAQGTSIGHPSALPATGPSTPPVTTGALAALPAASTVATVPAPAGVTPIAAPPVPTDLDIDHGKGRDRDDTIHKHPGRGKALGLRK
ncbi:MAG: sigma-70 family RNA polymerase sigma factor, partial [Chloroflexi bacterium]